MRREDFTVDGRGIDESDREDGSERPTLVVSYGGDPDTLRDHLESPDGEKLVGGQADVSFRLLSELGSDDGTGVLAITDRLTGDFVLEANATVELLLEFVRAARRFGEATDGVTGQYEIRVEADGEPLVTFEKRTLLVYNDEGDLLRERSLIPGGVEL